MIGVFGRKIGMTQIFTDNGVFVPVTRVKIETCQVSQLKTLNIDGYNAIQISYGDQKLKNLTKPQLGHLKKSNSAAQLLLKTAWADRTQLRASKIEFLKGPQYFSEFRVSNPLKYKLGQILDVSIFNIGQKLSVSGKNIGKGFSGNQKRHNFSRGPMTHGSKNHCLPGSIGAGSTPGRVYPGKRMAGRRTNKLSTVKNIKILFIDPSTNTIVVKGSLPGKKNNLLRLKLQ